MRFHYTILEGFFQGKPQITVGLFHSSFDCHSERSEESRAAD